MLTLMIVAQIVLTALTVFLTILAFGLAVKVQQLEQAMKIMTPDHNLDAVERRLGMLETAVVDGLRATDTAVKSITQGILETYGKVEKLREYADDTFYRKDHVA